MTTWAVVASGPSLTREDVDKAASLWPVATVNASFRMCPGASICYGYDPEFWDHYGPEAFEVCSGAEFWTANRDAAHAHNLKLVPSDKGAGLHPEPGHITLSTNSGYQALHLVATLGATWVVLLGYDFQYSGVGRIGMPTTRPGSSNPPGCETGSAAACGLPG